MPCSDWGGSIDRENSFTLAARNKELAQELCRTQKFIQTLFADDLLKTDQRQFHIGLHNEMQRILRLHKEHRLLDQKEALRQAEKRFTELNNRRKQIEGLGGHIGEELATQLALVKEELKQIPLADPLTTDLY